ncbi:MAG: hypothetical protein J0I40_03460, partial [Cellulomonas sp.]|nr:hypothetical protein [Cellulomonas sp.]
MDKVPSYSKGQADKLAQVVADPVVTAGSTATLFGGASVPFFLVVALWLGGLATFVVLGATAPRVVGSTRSSLRLAVTSFVPGAVIGAVQGAALTAAMAGALNLSPGGWVAFTALAALVGVAFAAVNQGLVAAFRGTGRFVSVIVAVVGLATAVVSTVPRLLDDVAGMLPIAPARAALQAVVTGSGVGGPVALRAGRDISNSGTPLGKDDPNGQMRGNVFAHAYADDITVVEAGRDIRHSSFYVVGPGLLGRGLLVVHGPGDPARDP